MLTVITAIVSVSLWFTLLAICWRGMFQAFDRGKVVKGFLMFFVACNIIGVGLAALIHLGG